MWGNPTLLNLLKKYWKKITNYWLGKVNIYTINPLATSNATCRDSLTLRLMWEEVPQRTWHTNIWATQTVFLKSSSSALKKYLANIL